MTVSRATTVYYCASSLDGYIAGADDSLDWLLEYQGTFEHESAEPNPMSEGGAYERFYEDVRALVAGSATYEWILDHLDVAGGDEWPYRGKPYWVLSSRELRVPEGEGVDVRVVDASVAELYDEMAAAAGDGKRLFERRIPSGSMRLAGTRAFRNGMVELRYEIRR